DLLVTIGGASMGTGDLVKRALDRIGFELDFWRVSIRPGSPFGFGRIPREGRPPLPVASLPGNPASAFVTFELFVRPLLLRLAGHEDLFRPGIVAIAGDPFRRHPRLTLFPRVTLEDADAGRADAGRADAGPFRAHRVRAHLAGAQSSGLVGTLARAHGLAVLPPAASTLPAGAPLRVILLRPEWNDTPDPRWLRPLELRPLEGEPPPPAHPPLPEVPG
ncbi:MAG: molybdopterin-binding protein, partial [Longimicrobiales bacterium]|nr:molybdopterin-binding protein [Longimicrobiales bacterium]